MENEISNLFNNYLSYIKARQIACEVSYSLAMHSSMGFTWCTVTIVNKPPGPLRFIITVERPSQQPLYNQISPAVWVEMAIYNET